MSAGLARLAITKGFEAGRELYERNLNMKAPAVFQDRQEARPTPNGVDLYTVKPRIFGGP